MSTKAYIAVMAWTAGNRIAKYRWFDQRADADAHVVNFIDRYPDAFVVPIPAEGGIGGWLVDPVAKSLSHDPLPAPPLPPAVLNVDGLAGLLVTKGVVTQAEVDAKKV